MSIASARGVLLATGMLIVIVYAVTTGVRAVHASESQQAYTLEDPVRPGGIGLATRAGRYSISLGDACATSGITANMNVSIIDVEGFTGIAVISPADGSGGECPIRIEQIEANVPCFTFEDGVCDILAETGE